MPDARRDVRAAHKPDPGGRPQRGRRSPSSKSIPGASFPRSTWGLAGTKPPARSTPARDWWTIRCATAGVKASCISGSRPKLSDSKYTVSAEFDWPYCTPLINGGSSWGIYVTGTLGQPFVPGGAARTDGVFLEADVKFTELVAEIVSSVLRLNRYERQKSGLRQFFALPILSRWGTISTRPSWSHANAM